MNKLQFEERTDANYTKYKFLENANNPVGKIMTENSNLKSSIFTRNVIAYYTMQLTTMEYIDPDAAKDINISAPGLRNRILTNVHINGHHWVFDKSSSHYN
jgi:hypothetical protein